MKTPWLRDRAAGVLLHPTSLPGAHGVGSLGAEARQFVEFLVKAGFSTWQVCPLGPTGYGNSPYASFSAFALNPYLIDIPLLASAGWMPAGADAPLRALPGHRVDFGGLYERKWPVLRAAFRRWVELGRPAHPEWGDYAAFAARHEAWLPAFSTFLALKESRGGQPWWDWPAHLRSWAGAAGSAEAAAVSEGVEFHGFLQFVAFGQWLALRGFCNRSGVELIGDIPLFVALDSADVWTAPGLFQLDRRTARPTAVAGVPPDYFSADGQLWGNPLYDWKAMARDGYAWWLERLALNFTLCDVVRIDHFRGFESYWSVPAGASTARAGTWVPGPGMKFFNAVEKRFPGAKLIAEDLGDLTEAVHRLRQDTALPGMAILQFAFGGDASNLYLPHNHEQNCVVYPGTHDNPTTREWYDGAGDKARDHVRRYLRVNGAEIAWDLVRASYASPARLAVLAMQDIPSLGAEARFNTPGRADGNWEWRLVPGQLERFSRESSTYLRELGALYGRGRA
jgi:4-alpha-glucanotransferase